MSRGAPAGTRTARKAVRLAKKQAREKQPQASAEVALGRAMPRTASISPDRFGVAVCSIVLVATIMTASFIFSAATITEAGAWTGAPRWAYPLAAVFIDGPIIAYTVTYSIWRFRGGQAVRSLVFLYLFTSISTVVNVAHSLAFNNYDPTRPETYFGSVIAAAAPLGALLASEEVIRLVLRRSPLPDAPSVGDASTATARAAGYGDADAGDQHHLADPSIAGAPGSSVTPAPAGTVGDGVAAHDGDAPFDPDHDLAPDEAPAAVDDAVWSELSFDQTALLLDAAPERQAHA